MKFKLLILLIVFFLSKVHASSSNVEQNQIFKNIRCLVCQGQSIADSNSDFAQTIKLVIKDKIKEGKTEKEIYNFLIEKYGQWIVYKPPMNGSNLLFWLFPYLIFIAGGIAIIMFFKKKENN